jgi:hypothetical protein
MEKTALGLIAALSAAAAAGSASASVAPATTEKILNPTSIAELLDPIPNALATAKELDADGRTLAPVEVADALLSVGPDGVRLGHRHHHHHHVYYHHHHHHHYHHHHHHHHRHYY